MQFVDKRLLGMSRQIRRLGIPAIVALLALEIDGHGLRAPNRMPHAASLVVNDAICIVSSSLLACDPNGQRRGHGSFC